MLLCDAYWEDTTRRALKLNPKIAPYKVAVFPLLKNKPMLVNKTRKVYEELVEHMAITWDDRGNIGKRYYYQDEIGTPYCITIDFDTLQYNTVTVRDRDTMEQIRISTNELLVYSQYKLQ